MKNNSFEKEYLPISSLHGKHLGNYQIALKLKSLKYRKGWTHFSLYLKEKQKKYLSKAKSIRKKGSALILEGIHSEGGRGIKGWIEVGNYFPIVYLETKGRRSILLDLSKNNLDRKLFQLLAQHIPPGGHFMFAYEIFYESSLHEETIISLAKNIPPVCTAQGELLFQSGFRFIKNWYLSEGGHEGPSKLWGEKPLNEDESSFLDLRTFFDLIAFLSRKPDDKIIKLERPARRRALDILAKLKLKPGVTSLRKKIINTYQNFSKERALKKSAQQTCHLIKRFIKTSPFADSFIMEKLLMISSDCTASFKQN